MKQIRQHTDAGLLNHQIRSVVSAAYSAIDAPTNRATFPVGPCPQILDEPQECDGAVWAYIPTDPAELATMRCHTCASVWYGWQWLRTGKRIVEKAERTGWRIPLAAND